MISAVESSDTISRSQIADEWTRAVSSWFLHNNKLVNNVLTHLNCDTRHGSSVHIIPHLRDQMPASSWLSWDSLIGMRRHQFFWHTTCTKANHLQKNRCIWSLNSTPTLFTRQGREKCLDQHHRQYLKKSFSFLLCNSIYDWMGAPRSNYEWRIWRLGLT